MAKWPQRNPLRLLFQWRGWKSTLSASFITFSEREPFLRGFLWWNSCNYWSQRCIGVSKTCGRSFVSFWRNLAISEEISWAFSFKFASSSPSVFSGASLTQCTVHSCHHDLPKGMLHCLFDCCMSCFVTVWLHEDWQSCCQTCSVPNGVIDTVIFGADHWFTFLQVILPNSSS